MSVKYSIALAEKEGFKPYVPGMDIKAGDSCILTAGTRRFSLRSSDKAS